MEAWLAKPSLLQPDANARYAKVFEIDLADVREPLLACPNDPDDVRPLSALAGTPIDEVFVGSCMTNIGHFRAVARVLEGADGGIPTRLWLTPPTKMDQAQLKLEGVYAIFGGAGARTEIPGCSLCMGNQARVAAGCTAVSTSTRNFPNRLGDGANVYLGSAELAAVTAVLGRLPTLEEYAEKTACLEPAAGEIYRYLCFDEIPAYRDAAGV